MYVHVYCVYAPQVHLYVSMGRVQRGIKYLYGGGGGEGLLTGGGN